MFFSQSIPGRFANNFNGHISEVVSLKSPGGKTWSIGVGNNANDELMLQSGWKEFVSAHSIEEGDYLLFKYSGVSSFDVLMFDSSGCEKTAPHFAQIHGCERIEGSAGVEGAQLELAVQRNTSRSIPNPCKRKLCRDIGRSMVK